MDTDRAISILVANSIVSSSGNSSQVMGFARAKRPTAEGMEINIMVFTAWAVLSLASASCLRATSWDTVGMMAAAMAEEKAMGMLEIFMARPLNTP